MELFHAGSVLARDHLHAQQTTLATTGKENPPQRNRAPLNMCTRILQLNSLKSCLTHIVLHMCSCCLCVPKQLILQARRGHSEVDNCNFNAHLKGNRNTHKQEHTQSETQTATTLHAPKASVLFQNLPFHFKAFMYLATQRQWNSGVGSGCLQKVTASTLCSFESTLE